MIVIMGATGTIGSALLERLADLGVPAKALSREPEKLRDQIGEKGRSTIEIASADASDPESLRRAFTGASQLFLTMANSPRQIELETSIIQIAAESGIEHIVKISSPAFEQRSPVAVAGWHQEIERTLRESGLTHTVLRPYAFMQNLMRLAPTITTQNVFFGSMGDSPCNFIDCRDIADVAAEVLTNRKVSGQIYTLTGSETFSYPQIASQLSVLLNRPISYINLEPQVLLRNLIENGHMPPWLANHVVEIQTMSTVVPESPNDTVKRLLGREPRTLEAFLHECVENFR
ncbi:SDR family NAD(P)-dependent oxidoreductase [Paenibacillus chitinolyticus]|uniref:SDR family NAD(P)-dependent oxidoreductase n=1 Tax=Paenibacillus chitinolyticus TaxID=79263 RepID=A0A410WYL5_9BACL|nr:SDR family oxidoreductase [Paenibacillus chitinolyticus]MCY9590592.1 SDR family oxidoreductase [Paenibacillus chitinolyticus]MCY9596413.1 SDR family oxidoreductase [Paenibacillus chitinolyticus]QAV19430.1 SDR family NAD(P)-dependent oxidoreductase [Paenibacillus chitinolyticus]